MSVLFSPLTLRTLTLKNRLVVSPMCQYSSTDGFVTDWHLVHLGTRAVGGAGLVIQEATAVSPEGRISAGDAGIWKDAHIEKERQITEFIRAQGSAAGIQLAHAGRKGSCDVPWEGGKHRKVSEGGYGIVAPSAIAFSEGDEKPDALSADGIRKIIQDFAAAARRAGEAGFEVVEIHGAHGYLLHQFLSPLSNKRTDEYGGSFENRTRLIVEVTNAVRSVWPATLPLFVRLSATDWAEGGWNENESAALAKILKMHGADVVDCSSGGLVPHVKIPTGPGYQVPFAEKIRSEAEMATGAVGLITEAQQAEEILTSGKADLIFIAREFLRDPYFPLHAAKALGKNIAWPVQYLRAKS